MHHTRIEIEKIIRSFQEALKNQGIKTDKIILFGSYAKGVANKYSDIDLIIVSRDFDGMSFMHRCDVLGKAIAEIMEPIEPLAYTPEELKKLSPANIVTMVLNKSEYMLYS